MISTADFDTAPLAPSSPPGMTTSKSSKSSSFQSSVHSDDASVLDDVGHFEDIGLDDDSATLKSTRQPGIDRITSQTAATSTTARSLVTSKRTPAPRSSSQSNLRSTLHTSNPRSTSLTVLTDSISPTSPRRRSSNSNFSSRSQPGAGRRRSPSPSISSNPRDPTFLPRPRRGSWQSTQRKSLAELEHECDEDEDDDIPDGLVLDNVPMSPRPQHERPPSRQPSLSPSPDRGQKPKDRVRSVGNGTPAVAQAQGSLKSPKWKEEAAQVDRSPNRPNQTRAHSWNAALAHLSAEAKALTEKLEEHADEEEERARRPSASGRPNTWNSMQRSHQYAYDKKERVKSTPELPPLRRTNVMIDPLPVSKEKEAVLSRTRPSWLPPKDPAEERRHIREYQKMMAASAKADERREAARRSRTEARETTLDGAMHAWEHEVIPNWNQAIRERRTRDMWWKGVPPRSRGIIWLQAIGNDLGLTEASFETALQRAHELESRVKQDKGNAEDHRKAQWFTQIRQDAAHDTWQGLHIFDVEGPLHGSLVDVLMAYAMYRNDIGYVHGCNTITALLLLNLTSPAAVFVALANILNRPLPLSFCTSDYGAQASAYNYVLQGLSQKSPTLHEHLVKVIEDADPAIYLQQVFASIFTAQLSVDTAARLWDVYVFEGDSLLVRAAVALLLEHEMTLLGVQTGSEVKSTISKSLNPEVKDESPTLSASGAEDKFIAAVKAAGRT